MHKIAFIFSMMILLVCGMQNAVAQQNSLTIGGQEYTLSQDMYADSMIYGQVKTFTFQIVPTSPDTAARYGFYLDGYGEGFPLYSIISNQSSGGAMGVKTITIQFTDYLVVGEYDGYLPIHIYENETNVSEYLSLYIHMKVKP